MTSLFHRARAVSPGGVHSPVRSFRGVGGDPVFIQRAEGPYLWDADGKRYVDFCMAFGPLILGHQPAAVREAAENALADGWSYGAAEPYSLELAELITDRIPWIEKIRFVNSGTEAVMSALRVARAATGRSRLVKFEGCYHGHVDSMLVQSGSGLLLQGEASSAGISKPTAGETTVLPLGDLAALERAFRVLGKEVAAVIIEPLPANDGLRKLNRTFLVRLRELCSNYGALLIFDEVISGFRLGFGGCAESYGITPDLVTYGKVIGGGFPVGAFAGPAQLMDWVAPLGPVYQAGTLSANPVAMRVGLATLKALTDGTVYQTLAHSGAYVEDSLADAQHIRCTREQSILWFQVDNYPAFFQFMLRRGFYLPPSPYEVAFLSSAHGEHELSSFIEACHAADRRLFRAIGE